MCPFFSLFLLSCEKAQSVMGQSGAVAPYSPPQCTGEIHRSHNTSHSVTQ